jgi:hypothetical protein
MRRLSIPLAMQSQESAIWVAGKYLRRILLEVQRPCGLPGIYIPKINDYLIDLRQIQNLRSLRLGEKSFCCSLDAVNSVVDHLVSLCAGCRLKSGRLDPNLLPYDELPLITSIFQVIEKEDFHLDALESFLQEEAAAAYRHLDDEPAIHEEGSGNHRKPTEQESSSLHAVAPCQTATVENSRDDIGRRRNKLKLTNWAIGLEDHQNWWLFHRKKDRWEEHRKMNFPRGRAHFLLQELAERSGVMSSREARKCLRAKGAPGEHKPLMQAVTDALKVPRRLIKETLSEITGQPFDEIGDPIPNHRGAWVAEIEIGFAVKDANQCLTFRKREQMSGPVS